MSRPHPLATLRRVDRATPLRIKLVLVVLVLAGAGLTLAATATTTSLKSYLVGQLDDQLSAALDSRIGTEAYGHFPDDGQPPGGGPGFGTARDSGRPALPSPLYVVHFNADGTPNGQPQQATLHNQSPPQLPTLTTTKAQSLAGHALTVPSENGHGAWRVMTRVTPDGTGTVAVAISMSDTDRTVHHVILLESGIGAVAVVLMGFAGYILIRRSLRPLDEVETTAAAIAAGNLSQRVPELPQRTEVGRLSTALNGMLAQIETAFDHERRSQQRARESEERMRRFVGDASHELRTPLTSIRGFAELYRMGAVDDAGELPRLMRRIEDEASRMGLLVEDLLLLARLDQQRPLDHEPVDLLHVATDVVSDIRVVAPDREVSLSVEAAQPPVVRGDEPRLRQVVTNLVNNAVSHTPDGAPIEVVVRVDGPSAVLEVADRGPGIAPAIADRIFERFYRADVSRSRAAGGSGLGLSIVASLVKAHGGTVGVAPRNGGGSVFWVRLPLLAEEQDSEPSADDRTRGTGSAAVPTARPVTRTP